MGCLKPHRNSDYLRSKRMKQSKAITFIGGYHVFSAIVVLLSLLLNGSPMNTVFGVPQIPDYIVKILIVIIYIPTGYLFMRRVTISYWILLILQIIFFFVSASLAKRFSTQPYIGNMLYSLFVIVVSILRRKEFCNHIDVIWDRQ